MDHCNNGFPAGELPREKERESGSDTPLAPFATLCEASGHTESLKRIGETSGQRMGHPKDGGHGGSGCAEAEPGSAHHGLRASARARSDGSAAKWSAVIAWTRGEVQRGQRSVKRGHHDS